MNLTVPTGRYSVGALTFALGAVAALGQAPWSLWWLSLSAFCGVFVVLSEVQNWRRAAWTGWSTGAGYFAVALFWIVEPFLVDIGRHGWMAPFALFLMAGGFAVFWGLAFGVAHRIGGTSRQVFCAVIALTGAELLRGVILTGFPWAMIGHVWIGHPVMQLAGLGGAGLLSLLLLGLAAFPVIARRPWAGCIAAAAVLAAAWGYGVQVLKGSDVAATDKLVRLVQPNAAQHLKWDPNYAGLFFSRQLAMTAEPSDSPLGLIVWPETSVTTLLDRAAEPVAAIAQAAGGVPVVFGANDLVEDSYRNSLAVLDGSGVLADIYHKHHLVPFGEYVPLGEVMGWLGIRGMAARDGGGFAPGPGARLLEIEGMGRALPLICYELIFPRHLRTSERPDFIVQITNDAWFGNISGPYQHLAQARLRAVEQGLPLVRAANTGVSAAIDPLGRIIRQTPLNEAGYLDAVLPKALPPTLYARMGDWPLALLLGVLLFAPIAARRRNLD